MATKVGDNEIISKINQTAEQIQIQASKVNLTGYITATNLATAGQTVINGGNITTGSISADRISGGTLTVGGLNNASGQILIKDSNNDVVGSIDKDCYMLINPSNNSTAARFGMYQNTHDAYIYLYDSDDGKTVELNASNGQLNLHGNNGSVTAQGNYGIIDLNDGTYNRVTMQGFNGTILLRDANNVNQVLLSPASSGSQFLVPLYTYGGLFANNGLTADNATVTGVLDVTQRRCEAGLSSDGWYRVMTIAGGNGRGGRSFAIDINITRTYNNSNNEVHYVKLLQTYNAIPSFADEASKTNALVVDKIRYTIDSNNNGHLDIHYNASMNNDTAVDFTVHTDYRFQYLFTSENMTSMGTADPPNESVLAIYEFVSNTDGPILISNTATSVGGTISVPGMAKYRTLVAHTNTSTSNPIGTRGVATIPVQALGQVNIPVCTESQSSYIRVQTSGDILYYTASGISGLYILSLYGII